MPETNLDDQRSDENNLAVNAAIDAKLPPTTAAAIALSEYTAGQTMTLSELAATGGEGVCLGLCLSTTSGVWDDDRTHYMAMKLVRVALDAFTVCVCDGFGTCGELRELEAALNAKQLGTGIYVAFGLYVDNQLVQRQRAVVHESGTTTSQRLCVQRCLCTLGTRPRFVRDTWTQRRRWQCYKGYGSSAALRAHFTVLASQRHGAEQPGIFRSY